MQWLVDHFKLVGNNKWVTYDYTLKYQQALIFFTYNTSNTSNIL